VLVAVVVVDGSATGEPPAELEGPGPTLAGAQPTTSETRMTAGHAGDPAERTLLPRLMLELPVTSITSSRNCRTFDLAVA
jgi:hypothetical protein